MATARVTEAQINANVRHLSRVLSRSHPGVEVKVELRVGNREYRVSNKLLVTFTYSGGRSSTYQPWTDGMAGFTKREAWNALRLMIATLGLTDD